MYGFVLADLRLWKAGQGPQGLCVAEGAPRGSSDQGQGGGEGNRDKELGSAHSCRPSSVRLPWPCHQASGKAPPQLQGRGGSECFSNTSDSWHGPGAPGPCPHLFTPPLSPYPWPLPHQLGDSWDQRAGLRGPWLPSLCSFLEKEATEGGRHPVPPPPCPWLTHRLGGSLLTQEFENSTGACRVPHPPTAAPHLGTSHCCPTPEHDSSVRNRAR